MTIVILTGDWHIGSGSTNETRIMYLAVNEWKDKPVILMGDLIDCGLDRGMEFDNDINPQDQIDKIAEIAKVITVKGYVLGNHSLRIFKKTGLNPYKQIFGIQPQYDYVIDRKTIHINHGKSTAQNAFLEHSKIAQWCGADLIALGHSHVLAKQTVIKEGKLKHYVRTGCLFEQPEYAKEAGYAPQLQGYVEYNTQTNIVTLKAIYEGRVIDI